MIVSTVKPNSMCQKNWEVLISLVHEKLGHPGLQVFWAFWERRYVTLDATATKNKAQELLQNCFTCGQAKPNSNADRGRPASLAVPLFKQAEVAVDLVVMPDQTKVPFICETLQELYRIHHCQVKSMKNRRRKLFGRPG